VRSRAERVGHHYPQGGVARASASRSARQMAPCQRQHDQPNEARQPVDEAAQQRRFQCRMRRILTRVLIRASRRTLPAVRLCRGRARWRHDEQTRQAFRERSRVHRHGTGEPTGPGFSSTSHPDHAVVIAVPLGASKLPSAAGSQMPKLGVEADGGQTRAPIQRRVSSFRRLGRCTVRGDSFRAVPGRQALPSALPRRRPTGGNPCVHSFSAPSLPP
jgi:hypothetical protein